jgi:hypothetical protein
VIRELKVVMCVVMVIFRFSRVVMMVVIVSYDEFGDVHFGRIISSFRVVVEYVLCGCLSCRCHLSAYFVLQRVGKLLIRGTYTRCLELFPSPKKYEWMTL